jgi:RNA polymerase sigma-70 factor (ECF subfamily)
MTIKEFKTKLLPLKNKLFRLSLNLMNNKDDAEDAVQEAYIKIWKMQDKINSVKNIEAFMMTITRNICLDKLKSKRNKFLTLVDDITKVTSSNPYEITEQADLVNKVKQSMQQLPEQQRTLIHLRDIEGYEFHEILEITGWDMNYMRVNLSRGRKKIKETILKLQHYETARN